MTAITAPVFLSRLLASGGDGRIAVPAGGNVNVYGASPFPRSVLGYAASTANDISGPAFAHLVDIAAGWPSGEALPGDAYRAQLERLRLRIRTALALDPSVGIAFAPSGTDLEFTALAIARARGRKAVRNILLGCDEIGSGCATAAAGRYFADTTALRPKVAKGAFLPGLEDTEVIAVPVRDPAGTPRDAGEVTAELDRLCIEARAADRHILAHVVHGSKTGLVLPDLAGLDLLAGRHGETLTLVVDACQARLSSEAVAAYLERDAIVLLTGSKFIGGPPFSGIALIPARLSPTMTIPAGLGTVFRRAELPLDWPLAEGFDNDANPGLLLRLEAAVFELERFGRIPSDQRARVISGFADAIDGLTRRLGVALVTPSLASAELHHATLATLDLSALPGAPDFATAQLWGKVLAARGIRLGQPVRCVRRADESWAGTLRISLSMPLIVEFAALSDCDLASRLACDMAQVGDVLEAAQRRVAH